MSTDPEVPRDGAGRMFVSGLLVLLGIAGLLASLCGGFFTLMAIADWRAGSVVIGIALPSLLVGGLVAWVCFRAVGRRHRTGPFEDEAVAGDADDASTPASPNRED